MTTTKLILLQTGDAIVFLINHHPDTRVKLSLVKCNLFCLQTTQRKGKNGKGALERKLFMIRFTISEFFGVNILYIIMLLNTYIFTLWMQPLMVLTVPVCVLIPHGGFEEACLKNKKGVEDVLLPRTNTNHYKALFLPSAVSVFNENYKSH